MADIASLKQEYKELMQKAKSIQEEIKKFNKKNSKVIIKSLSHNDFQHSLNTLGNTSLRHISNYGKKYVDRGNRSSVITNTFINSYEDNTYNYTKIKEFFNIETLVSPDISFGSNGSHYIKYNDIRNILKNKATVDILANSTGDLINFGPAYSRVDEYPSYRAVMYYKE